MKPTIGRIVIYNTTQAEQDAMSKANPGCNVQQKLPAMVVAVWGDECVNLKVILDGPGELWVTSANKGDAERNWNFPVIQ